MIYLTNNDRPVKKVLMNTDTVGGVWVFALQLIEALQKYDIQVTLATMGKRLSAWQWEEIKKLPNCDIFESEYKLEWMEEPWEDVEKAGKWLLKIETIVSPDIIHLNSYVHAALPWHSPVVLCAHSCVYSWFQAVKGKNPPSKWLPYYNKVLKGLHHADIIVAPSRAMLHTLDSMYGLKNKNKVWIYNGTKMQKKNISNDPFILSAGRVWDDAKNISVLNSIGKKIPWPIFVAGQTAHPDGGQKLFDHLHMLGHCSQDTMQEWYGKASIFVSPALYEPFGLSVLEAAHAGCALVLSNIATFRELWPSAAIFVDPSNTHTWHTAILSLIENQSMRKKYAQKAVEHAQKYTPEIMAQKYCQIYMALKNKKSEGCINTQKKQRSVALSNQRNNI